MVHKANSIAQFFASYPREEAVEGVEKHLLRFWPPPMRTQLCDYLAAGGTGLHHLVVAAAEKLQPSKQEVSL